MEVLVTMSGINFFSRMSGSGGTAAVRALDKSARAQTQQEKAREERIAELKQQYENGRYLVDSVQLSSAIVEDLLNNKR
jgi:anti-sigma28 factor (negative regulator of flagellin synthesis)